MAVNMAKLPDLLRKPTALLSEILTENELLGLSQASHQRV
jgi:hypothetical protein